MITRRFLQRGEALLVVLAAVAAVSGLVALLAGTRSAPQDNAVARLTDVWQSSGGTLLVGLGTPAQDIVIDQDSLVLHVSTDAPGHLVLVSAGTDGHSLSVVYPNAQEPDRRLEPGIHTFPRPGWQLAPVGPDGTGAVLAVFSERPLDAAAVLAQIRAGQLSPEAPHGTALLLYREHARR